MIGFDIFVCVCDVQMVLLCLQLSSVTPAPPVTYLIGSILNQVDSRIVSDRHTHLDGLILVTVDSSEENSVHLVDYLYLTLCVCVCVSFSVCGISSWFS